MSFFRRIVILLTILLPCATGFASDCGDCIQEFNGEKCDTCCGKSGGVSYCDSSAGRIVCKNGNYSTCYCDRHAVMDLTHIQGCCIWQGGVLTYDHDRGYVICNNGGISQICSEGDFSVPNVATW